MHLKRSRRCDNASARERARTHGDSKGVPNSACLTVRVDSRAIAAVSVSRKLQCSSQGESISFVNLTTNAGMVDKNPANLQSMKCIGPGQAPLVASLAASAIV